MYIINRHYPHIPSDLTLFTHLGGMLLDSTHHYGVQLFGMQITLGKLLDSGTVYGANDIERLLHMCQGQSKMVHKDIGISEREGALIVTAYLASHVVTHHAQFGIGDRFALQALHLALHLSDDFA